MNIRGFLSIFGIARLADATQSESLRSDQKHTVTGEVDPAVTCFVRAEIAASNAKQMLEIQRNFGAMQARHAMRRGF